MAAVNLNTIRSTIEGRLATELALSEMAMKIGFSAGPLIDSGVIEHINYEDGRPTSEKIEFKEISIG